MTLLHRLSSNAKPELAERSIFSVAESWLRPEGMKTTLFPANLPRCIKRGGGA